MSRSLGTNSGSFDSLNRRTRCGCRPCACQIRCTEETLMPTVLAITPAVQCVVSSDGSSAVRATTCSIIAGSSGLRPGGRVLSRSRPSTPSRMNRSCQRHTTDLARPVLRMIPFVPSPSAVNRMIFVRQTCFCGLLRFATTARRRARSALVTLTMIPLRIPQTRTRRASRESSKGLERQVGCTRGLHRLHVVQ